MSTRDLVAARVHARRSRGGGAAAVAAAALVASLLAGCTTGPTGGDGSPTGSSPAATEPSPGSPTTSGEPEPTADPAPTPSPEPTTAPTPSASPEPTTEPSATPTPAEPSPTPTPEPTEPGTAPTPTPTAPPPPEPAPTAAPEPPPEPPTLRRGDEGEAVRVVQERLIELDYFLPTADGIFGPATEQAVWALQKAAGVTRDGLVGPVTREALDSGTRPTPWTWTGRTIEIDLDRQLVLAVDDGVVTRTFNASSGNGETYEALGRTQRATTPTGDFTVVRQIDAMHESTLGLGMMYRPKYFYRGWAVHGSDHVPPWPASHGCVRVSNAAISWIWDSWGAPLGTRVLVY